MKRTHLLHASRPATALGLATALAATALVLSGTPVLASPSNQMEGRPGDRSGVAVLSGILDTRVEQHRRGGGNGGGGRSSSGGGQAVPRGGSSGGSSAGSSGGSGGGGSTRSGGAVTRGDSGSASGESGGTTTTGAGSRAREGRPVTGTAVGRRDDGGSRGGDTIIVGGGYYGGGYYPWGWGGLGLGGYYGWYDPWGYGYDPYYPPYGYDRGYYADGSLKLKVTPRQAEVLVDGYFAGTVDDYDGLFQKLHLEPGPHRIEIRNDGYEPLSFEVRIQPDRTVTYKGELKKEE